MSLRVCSSCGAVNEADAEECARCGTPLPQAPATVATAVPPPPIPVLDPHAGPLDPPPSDPLLGEAPPPGPSRRRWWIPAAAAVLVVLVVIALLVTRGGDEGGLPDQVAGLGRLHTAEVQALENGMGQIKIGDIEIETAAYGSGEEVKLFVVRYRNLPSAGPISSLIRGAGGGIIGTGGSVDFTKEAIATPDGIEVHCIPFTGRLLPTDPSESTGFACAWYEGQDAALLMDVGATDPDSAIADATTVHDALG
jgi:hypothetical protein